MIIPVLRFIPNIVNKRIPIVISPVPSKIGSFAPILSNAARLNKTFPYDYLIRAKIRENTYRFANAQAGKPVK